MSLSCILMLWLVVHARETDTKKGLLMDTKPSDVVVTRYDKKGNPIRKDYYQVTSDGLPTNEMYIESHKLNEYGVEKTFNSASSYDKLPKSHSKLVKSEVLSTSFEENDLDFFPPKSFVNYQSAVAYAKVKSVQLKVTHQVRKINSQWVVNAVHKIK